MPRIVESEAWEKDQPSDLENDTPEHVANKERSFSKRLRTKLRKMLGGSKFIVSTRKKARM